MKQKTCATCFYDTGKCEVLREKIPENCFAWADEAEAKRREKAIKNYADPYGNSLGKRIIPEEMISQRTRIRAENLKKRGGKSVREVLDEHFLELYNQDISDTAIGDMLGIDTSRVYDYRRSKKLPAQNKKNRPTAMVAAI